MSISCGCGSFADPDYAGLLYPGKFPSDLRLSAYAMWFDRLEVNATYYAAPKSAAVAQWIARTPAHFTFDIRLHRMYSISPQKSAQNKGVLARFLDGVAPLIEAKRLGAFLLVLPPNFAPPRHKLGELDALIDKLRPHPLAIELRHRDWVSGQARAATLAYFRRQKVTWVAVDMPRIADSELMPPVDEVTQPRLAYLRLHGRNPNWAAGQSAAEKHTYAYTDADLEDILPRIRHLAQSAKNVRVTANNHAFDFAPRTALALKERLGGFA